eukprot:1144920-Amphidinium_carterae.2
MEDECAISLNAAQHQRLALIQPEMLPMLAVLAITMLRGLTYFVTTSAFTRPHHAGSSSRQGAMWSSVPRTVARRSIFCTLPTYRSCSSGTCSILPLWMRAPAVTVVADA